jgi:hypothetical protein
LVLSEEGTADRQTSPVRFALAAGQALLLLVFLFFSGALVPEQNAPASRQSMSAMPASAAHVLQSRWDALRTFSAPERKSLAKAGWSGGGDGWLPDSAEWRFAQISGLHRTPVGDDKHAFASTSSYHPRAPPARSC